MMTVKRFKYSEVNEGWDLQLDDDGDLVDYTEYQKLEAENATLKAENKASDEAILEYGAICYEKGYNKALLKYAMGIE